jgi:hypothetical protein
MQRVQKIVHDYYDYRRENLDIDSGDGNQIPGCLTGPLDDPHDDGNDAAYGRYSRRKVELPDSTLVHIVGAARWMDY